MARKYKRTNTTTHGIHHGPCFLHQTQITVISPEPGYNLSPIKRMDVEEEKKVKKVDDILKEGLISAREHAEIIVHIINGMEELRKQVVSQGEAIQELGKGKKRMLE